VDEIGEVVAVNEAQFEASPDTLRGQARQLIDGVYKLKDRLMHVLSLERAVNVPSAEGSGETTEWRPATHCAA
jgi:purine-binding chemotaxis protein CheW